MLENGRSPIATGRALSARDGAELVLTYPLGAGESPERDWVSSPICPRRQRPPKYASPSNSLAWKGPEVSHREGKVTQLEGGARRGCGASFWGQVDWW